MKVYFTSSVRHLAKKSSLPLGKYDLNQFPDGEMTMTLKDNVRNTPVLVVAATLPPAENILELLFLLDALQRNGARIYLFFTYFGYARQDREEAGKPLSAAVISNLFSQFSLKKILIFHCHSSRLKQYLRYTNIIPLELFTPVITAADVLVAPDKGALPVVSKLASRHKKPVAYFTKTRTSGSNVTIHQLVGDVHKKKAIIVDDMISTGGTILTAAKKLFQHGATSVSVAATHGVFSKDALSRLERSQLQHLTVTNSLPQRKKSRKLRLIDISLVIERIAKEQILRTK